MPWRSRTTIATAASPVPKRVATGLHRCPGGSRLPLDAGSGQRRGGLRMIGEVAAICRGVSGFSCSPIVSLLFPQLFKPLHLILLLKTLLTTFILSSLTTWLFIYPFIDSRDLHCSRVADIGSTMLQQYPKSLASFRDDIRQTPRPSSPHCSWRRWLTWGGRRGADTDPTVLACGHEGLCRCGHAPCCGRSHTLARNG